MKSILFIHPNASSEIYQDLSKSLSAIEPPIWAGMLVKRALEDGIDAGLLDCEANRYSISDAVAAIDQHNPDIVAIVVYGQQPSASTQNMVGAEALSKALSTKKFKVLFIGAHPSALPMVTLVDNPWAYVCNGEGPETVKALCTEKPLEQVPGLWWEQDGYYHNNPPAPLINDLDQSLPGVQWSLLNFDQYRTSNWHALTNNNNKTPFASIYTSLGCPFNCTFCMINTPFGGSSFRYWSPEFTIKQLIKLADLGITNLKIADEMFVLKQEHFMRVCQLIIDRGLKFNIWAYARIDTVKEKYLDTLKRAGVNWLALGIESANKLVRTEVVKGRFEDTNIIDIVNKIRTHNINVIANFIFGLPDDNLSTCTENLKLALDLNCEMVNFYCFTEDTKVWTPNGLKKISTIEPGENVFSKDGITKVEAVLKREYTGDIIRIKPRYLEEFTCTPEHPFLLAKLSRSTGNKAKVRSMEWVKAKDIRVWDNNNLFDEYHAIVIDKNNFIEEDTFLDLSSYLIRKDTRCETDKERKYRQPIPITEGLAELFGWYVAEGSLNSRKNNQICFSLGSHEPENIARIRYLLETELGFKSRVITKDSVSRVFFTSKVFLRAVHNIFGKDSHTKKVPLFILRARKEIVKAFLKGYIDGDGTSWPNANRQYSCSTVSKELVDQLILCFIKTGIIPGYVRTEPFSHECNGKTIKSGICYKLSWTGKSSRYLQDERYFYIPIKSIESIPFTGIVYNLKTENETYSLPIITHNCGMAYPGSHLYSEAITNNTKLPSSWLGYSQHSYETYPLSTKYMSSKEVLIARDTAFNAYFREDNNRYYDMITDKFGIEATKAMKDMAKQKLNRKLYE